MANMFCYTIDNNWNIACYFRISDPEDDDDSETAYILLETGGAITFGIVCGYCSCKIYRGECEDFLPFDDNQENVYVNINIYK